MHYASIAKLVLSVKLPLLLFFSKMFLVCPMKHQPVLVEIDGENQVLPVGSEVNRLCIIFYEILDMLFYVNLFGKLI